MAFDPVWHELCAWEELGPQEEQVRKAVKTLLGLTEKPGTKAERVVDQVVVIVVKLLHSSLAASTLTG